MISFSLYAPRILVFLESLLSTVFATPQYQPSLHRLRGGSDGATPNKGHCQWCSSVECPRTTSFCHLELGLTACLHSYVHECLPRPRQNCQKSCGCDSLYLTESIRYRVLVSPDGRNVRCSTPIVKGSFQGKPNMRPTRSVER